MLYKNDGMSPVNITKPSRYREGFENPILSGCKRSSFKELIEQLIQLGCLLIAQSRSFLSQFKGDILTLFLKVPAFFGKS